ncbi:MAG: alpha-L-glutamate ligase [Oscillatoria sp. SIO1A7]|nr:alpha-L-glutamate ligase [Oscillatoria sp. SIO1A7]
MLTNISIAIAACEKLSIPYQIMHRNQNLVRFTIDNKYYFFVNYTPPFNDQNIAAILKDKEYTYCVLKDAIDMPITKGFLSPFVEVKYRDYLKLETIQLIRDKIVSEFPLPAIVKRNRGSAGHNVFICREPDDVENSLEAIFNVNKRGYDYVALAQEYVEISHEFRAVFFAKKLRLLYEKDNSNASFTGNLSPLHWEGAKARHITDAPQLAAIQQFVEPVFSQLAINYGGFDVALDKNGQYWLLEINSSPNFSIFIRDNKKQIAIDMFAEMLAEFRESRIC